MALTPGIRLGPYQIVTRLGAGGMGDVFRARDTTLNRDVAIKVLPDSFASDTERLARFNREAQTLAALNHPHIAQIYGLEESAGVRALVMELVEGEDLSQRVARGALPLDEALLIATQIAEALEAAHEQGIMHRDLKPANIKVRPDGTVKVLDFGLAKALEPVSARVDATASPTITSPAMMTGVGMLLGTAAYMSPEQARGQAVDKRSDIWAFGCVLYEMLAGQRAFAGENVTDTLAAVVRAEPAWDALPDGLLPSMELFLRRCLEKNPTQRLHDIADMRLALEGAFDTAVHGSRRMTAGHPRVWRRTAVVTTSALLMGAAVAGAAVWWTMRPASPHVVRTEIVTAGERALSIQGVNRDVAITPDGSRIIYRGENQLLVRALDQIEPDVLSGLGAGLGAPRGLFVSPDGQWIGFGDASTLKRVSIAGRGAVTIAQMDGPPRGATWLSDDTVIFATGRGATGLQRVRATGGEPTVLTTPDRERGEDDHVWPETLPGGQAVLFTITATSGGLDNAQIAVLDLATGAYKALLRGGHHAHYVPTGHLVYGAAGTLRAVRFDFERREVVGTPVPVLEGVVTLPSGAADVAVAANGTMVYVPGGVQTPPRQSVVWVDRMGREEPVGAPSRSYAYARLSPDGTRIALDVREEENDIWIWNLTRSTMTRLTFDPGNNRGPVWTPDGTRVAFTAVRDGGETIYWQAADGTGAPERLAQGPGVQVPNSFSPDGRRLVVTQPDGRPLDLGVVNVEGDRRAELILRAAYDEYNGEISPDGRWLAYQSNQSGRDEVYVRPFPNVDAGRWQVSTGGGTRPLWARNGRELFYFVAPGTVMAVPIRSGPTFAPDAPQAVFKGGPFGGLAGRHYDVSPDGRRFLMLKNEQATDDATPYRSLIVVQNWHEELKRLVPSN